MLHDAVSLVTCLVTLEKKFITNCRRHVTRSIVRLQLAMVSKISAIGAKSRNEALELKYVSKICGLNFEIVNVPRPCIRFFPFTLHFKALTE